MQLKQIARDALLKPLQAVSGIVERRHTLPILANVLLEQKDGRLYVTATDLEMQITAHSELAGKDGQATTVGARKLQDLLRALPDDATLNIDVGSSKMTVRAGRSRFNLQTLAAADYPRISLGTEQLQTLSLPQKDLRALFKLAEFAMAQQDIRYYLNGMLLVDRQGLAAGGGHRRPSAVVGEHRRRRRLHAPGSDPAAQDGARARQAARPTATTRSRIDILANQVRFRFGNVELVSKVVDGKFPDYNRVIPVGPHASTIELDRAELLAALQRAAILSNEKFRGVRLVLAADQLKIICTNSEQEEAEEELEVDYKGEPLDIGFNITYLLDVLQNRRQRQGAVRVRRRQFERAGHDARTATTTSTS